MQKILLFCAVLPSGAILAPFKNGDDLTELDISIEETTNLLLVHPKSPTGTFPLLRTSKLVSITVRPLSFCSKRKHRAQARCRGGGEEVGGERPEETRSFDRKKSTFLSHFGWMDQRLKS